MKIALVMAGRNVFGRIVAHELRRFDPLVVDEAETTRARRLATWQSDIEAPPLVGRILSVPDALGELGRAAMADCDYVINGGVGVIYKVEILSLPRCGFLNAHPGLLPEYRGADPMCWALQNGDDLGATVHLLDEGIDTGPILLRRPFSWRVVRTLTELRMQLYRLCGQTLAAFLASPDFYRPRPQGKGRTYGAFANGDPAEQERRLKPLLLARNAFRD
jgi:hypothetical protein